MTDAGGSPRDSDDQGPPPGPKRSHALRNTILAGLIWCLFAALIVGAYWMTELPDTANLLVYDPKSDVTILDDKGRLIARRGITQGDSIQVGALPPYVGDAFIAIEDRRFRSHFGVDIFGLTRAFVTDMKEGSFVQGGSTITQQLAKNLFLEPDRTIRRKIEEAFLALRLENRYSKDEILTLYLNHVYFGGGVYGIEAAAQRFYNKPAHDLTLTEAAILAGSVKAPSRYNPATDPDAASARGAVVLQAMEDEGFIDHAAHVRASATRPKIAASMATRGVGYFVDYVAQLVPEFAGKAADTAKERLIVETTLDLETQAMAERALASGLNKDGGKLAASQGALVALTPEGALRALVGGRSYDDSPFDRATNALRQPGSAFKAFVYLAALEHGRSPDDPVVDGPVTIGNWTPGNYEGKYEGQMTLAHALAHSSNSVAVQLTNEVGPAQVARVAHRLGVTAQLHEVPALALGTSEVTPLELVTGYAAFANGGTGVIPFSILRIRTASGKVLYTRRGSGVGRVMSEQNNAQMTQMMSMTVTEGTGTAARLADRPVAGKTGTSQDYRDAWFVGFSSDLVCGVWIGNDDNRPMKKATGGGLPARIFKTFMTQAERGSAPMPLAGSAYLVASNGDAAPAENAANDRAGDEDRNSNDRGPAREDGKDLVNAFENLLDRLF